MPSRYQGPMRTIGLVGGLGFVLGLSALLGALAGRFLDDRWGTEPWIALLGTLLGTAAGFYEVVAVLSRFGGESNEGA
ncbi:MAG TPA: AtpZ/AtpI family protein [Armatimonadota bacterium]|nr:AtpZ/AtpI family protein [Armatimonadota bacterium]